MSHIIKLPGLIDVHVHLRDDEIGTWAYKEDFITGTKAAIAGGYTCVIDMPNNPVSVVSEKALLSKIDHAKGRVFCDLGFHFGATPDNFPEYDKVSSRVFGLKIYMNHTTGQLLIDNKTVLEHIFETWSSQTPILVHAEAEMLEIAINLAKKYKKRLHACHVSLKQEIEMIKVAKLSGLDMTCEVSCHHLFLNEEDVKTLGPYGIMKPPLASKEDVDALWDNLDIFDCIASDHAPHTRGEKESERPPFGVPGLETSLPLMLTAVAEGRLTIEKLTELMSLTPRRIFNIPEQPGTFIEVDTDAEWQISSKNLFTKCGWTPFDGWPVKGKVHRVVLRGKIVFENGKVVGEPSGEIINL